MTTLKVLKEAFFSIDIAYGYKAANLLRRIDAEISRLESQKKVRGWAIVAPDEKLIAASSGTEADAWLAAGIKFGFFSRNHYIREGYRVVKVEITEVNAASQDANECRSAIAGNNLNERSMPAGAAPDERSEP